MYGSESCEGGRHPAAGKVRDDDYEVNVWCNSELILKVTPTLNTKTIQYIFFIFNVEPQARLDPYDNIRIVNPHIIMFIHSLNSIEH